MKRLTLLSWTVLIVLTLSVCACLVGCAHLPHKPDGSLDVQTLLVWANDGLDVGCSDQWVQVDACTYGRDAIRTAHAIGAKDPANIRAAVKQSLIDSEATLEPMSRLRPYLDWLIAIL